MKVKANGIDIEVEDTGGEGRPVVLLIMGLGMQLVAWPPGLVRALTQAGFRVVRHDNRDIGLSQKFDHAGTPHIVWESLKLKLGFAPKTAYTVKDMALDAIGVLDALGIAKAHVVGVSMGGMIAQRVALAAPDRVLSLTSIMSSSNARGLPEAGPKVIGALLSRPAGKERKDIVDHYVKLFKVIGSPAWPQDEKLVRERIAMGLDRSYYPVGTLRQMLAIAGDTQKRADELGRVTAPTLVLHGKADPLVPIACGMDTAKRIRGAKFIGIEGMGHDLPPEAMPFLLEPMLAHMKQAA